MAWFILIIAGLCETGWAVGLKYTAGFTRLWPTVWVIIAMLLSFFLLARAARTIHPPTAYSIWVGIGVLGAWIVSVTILKDPFRLSQMLFVTLILAGVIGLKLTMTSAPPAALPAATP
ncbi:MAG: multidrug efflux SMR transporter [Phycisphaerales bacterium]|nr:multidrug efflux SMR transporter [Phycisphaerales bacterium]